MRAELQRVCCCYQENIVKEPSGCNLGFRSVGDRRFMSGPRLIEANLSGERVTGGDVRRTSAARSKPGRERAALDDLKSCTIAVIGELMLDLFLHGHAERISPEARVAW